MAGLHITQIDNALLIAEIKSRPSLYTKEAIKLVDCNVRRVLWEEVASKVFDSDWQSLSKTEREKAVYLTTKRWKNLRACFSRELRNQNQPKCNNGSLKRHKYLYYNDLCFLKQEIDSKACDEDSNDVEEEMEMALDPLEDEKPVVSLQQTVQDTVSEVQERPIAPKPQTIKINAAVPTPMLLIDATTPASSSEVNSAKTNEIDSTNFALSLVPMLNMLPIDKRLDAQISILSILRKYYKNDETEQGASRKRKACTVITEVSEIKSEVNSDEDSEYI